MKLTLTVTIYYLYTVRCYLSGVIIDYTVSNVNVIGFFKESLTINCTELVLLFDMQDFVNTEQCVCQ